MNIFNEAVQKAKGYDPDLFLGRLVWYTVTQDVNVDHSEFCKLMLVTYEGVDTGKPKLPKVPRQRDVFKRACTEAERRKVPSDKEGVYYNYMVRPAGTDTDNVWRVVVREAVDASGHELDYTEFIRVNYNAQSKQISFEELTDISEDDTLESIKQEIRSYFHLWMNRLTAYTIRELARNNLERNMGAIKVRSSGGVYFVSEEFADQLEALETVINSLDDGTNFHSLPLLDDGKQREMLRAAFEEESVGECDRLIGEMTEILKSDKKITKDRFVQFKVEYDLMRRKVVDYSDLLDEKLDHTSTSLAIVKKTMTKLMGQIKVA